MLCTVIDMSQIREANNRRDAGTDNKYE